MEVDSTQFLKKKVKIPTQPASTLATFKFAGAYTRVYRGRHALNGRGQAQLGVGLVSYTRKPAGMPAIPGPLRGPSILLREPSGLAGA